jgi:hypothetical protein
MIRLATGTIVCLVSLLMAAPGDIQGCFVIRWHSRRLQIGSAVSPGGAVRVAATGARWWTEKAEGRRAVEGAERQTNARTGIGRWPAFGRLGG